MSETTVAEKTLSPKLNDVIKTIEALTALELAELQFPWARQMVTLLAYQ